MDLQASVMMGHEPSRRGIPRIVNGVGFGHGTQNKGPLSLLPISRHLLFTSCRVAPLAPLSTASRGPRCTRGGPP